jgi:hypothetical protein
MDLPTIVSESSAVDIFMDNAHLAEFFEASLFYISLLGVIIGLCGSGVPSRKR